MPDLRLILSKRMQLANRLDAIRRDLTYNGEPWEAITKHRLFEIVSDLGGTGVEAARPATLPDAGPFEEALQYVEIRRIQCKHGVAVERNFDQVIEFVGPAVRATLREITSPNGTPEGHVCLSIETDDDGRLLVEVGEWIVKRSGGLVLTKQRERPGLSPAAAAVPGGQREELRQALGEVLASTLAGMCEDDVAPDWHDARHVDELLDEVMPVLRVQLDPTLSDPTWSAVVPRPKAAE
jgi:hypothetical protein